MIETVTVRARGRLDPETKGTLKKFVRVSMQKLTSKDGWACAEKTQILSSVFTSLLEY